MAHWQGQRRSVTELWQRYLRYVRRDTAWPEESSSTARSSELAGIVSVTCGIAAGATMGWLVPDFDQGNNKSMKIFVERGVSNLGWRPRTLQCEAVALDLDGDALASGYTEAERFQSTLQYHQSLLHDYIRRWQEEAKTNTISAVDSGNNGNQTRPTHLSYPRRIPRADELPALELDAKFCKRSPTYRDSRRTCQDIIFLIASYYVMTSDLNAQDQRYGYRLLKDLAEQGHPDGMCLYGTILHEGLPEAGIDANPEQAVVWWRRCVDLHQHVQGTFELGVAMYIGEGVPENLPLAVRLLARAAHWGHGGAAYLLGECLLEGVGVEERDRAIALEWLVTAAELGHLVARRRVLAVLQAPHAEIDADEERLLRTHDTVDEGLKWVGDDDEQILRKVNIERRYSIGGGSKNPQVLAKRKTVVDEARETNQATTTSIPSSETVAGAWGSDNDIASNKESTRGSVASAGSQS